MTSLPNKSAIDLIQSLSLAPHPEGGHYRQTWVADNPGRPMATAILFLLAEGERSHWHKVDAAELWLFHAGSPLTLQIAESDAGPAAPHTLGPDPLTGQAPQVIVPAHHWQTAETTGPYTLVSCIVSPGFTFDGFTLAEPDFEIP
ncbi:cupin domain-containing protein [Aestuariibius sp. 2305UL40-4]|uniref:cupin domain-containing protein n=1 Tax=Aestuariibius violaceus TaxID=3234132 RepID=UPI00345E5908